jgi:hypothetical protein
MAMPRLTRPVRVTLFFVVILLALLAALGIGITYAYNDVFYPGVRVGDVVVGGLTRTQATTQLNARAMKIAERPVTVTLPDITQPKSAITDEYPITSP